MNILYFGSACSEERLHQIINSHPRPYFIAQYNLEMALIKGITENGIKNLKIYNIPQFKKQKKFFYFTRPTEKLIEGIDVSYLPVVNIPLIKELLLFVYTFFTTIFYLAKKNRKETVILSAFNYTPISLGTFFAAKILRFNRANIFTDLSKDIFTKKRQINMSKLKVLILPWYMKLISILDNTFDLYIILTKPMNEVVNKKNNPYIVMEGIYNDDLNLSQANRKNAIVYSGTLTPEYGVETILEAFSRIRDENIELWIMGSGPLEEQLKIPRKNVVFFGYLSRSEVFEKLKQSSLLINIRNPVEEYTKYSFPSKTFEYLASGTPVLSTILEGMPPKYFDFIIGIKNDDIETVVNSIETFFNNDDKDMYFSQAREGQKYVLTEKTPRVQAKKILNFLKENI